MTRPGGVDLANPLVIWTVVWLGILSLTQLQLTTQLYPLNAATVSLVVATILTFALLVVPISLYYRVPSSSIMPGVTGGELMLLRRSVRYALLFWAVGFGAEVIAAGGVPLLWMLAGDLSRGYEAFGIRSFHGFLLALFLFCVTGSFIEWHFHRRRRWLVLLIGLLSWPVLLLSRGLLMWEVLEIAGVYFLLNRVRWRQLLTGLVVTVAVILLIGWVGDNRAPAAGAALQAVVADHARPVFDLLPSGFLWVYVYATSPINNIVAAIENVQPLYTFYYSVVQLVPSVLRDLVFAFQGENKYALGLVEQAFNTGTVFRNYLADWGVSGAIIIVGLFQAVITYFYVAARRGLLWGVLGFAVFYPGIVLSGFSDQFAYLPAIAQVVLALYFKAASSPYRLGPVTRGNDAGPENLLRASALAST